MGLCPMFAIALCTPAGRAFAFGQAGSQRRVQKWQISRSHHSGVERQSILHDNFDRRALSTVAFALGYAACGNAQAHIHHGFKHNAVACFRGGRFHRNTAIGMDARIHKKVDRRDGRAMLAKISIDVIQAVRVAFAVAVKEIIHLRAGQWCSSISRTLP